jgi:signal transduction histidine kinase
LNSIYGNASIISDLLETTTESKSSVALMAHKEPNAEMLSDIKESVEAISNSAHHLKDIVDTVLNISALENKSISLQQMCFKPNDVIRLVASMFKAQLNEKKLHLKLNFASDSDVTVRGDAYRFKEIL